MTGSMYAAIAGLQTHMQKMNVIGNNIANANTYGFKPGITSFSESMYTSISNSTAGGAEYGGTNASQIGYGSQVASIDLNMTGGTYAMTGVPSHLYLNGNGFFLVGKKEEGVLQPNDLTLKRVGNFSLDSDGYLVDNNGYCVYGFMPQGDDAGRIVKDADGNITWDTCLRPLRVPVSAPAGIDGVDEGTALYPTPTQNATGITYPYTDQVDPDVDRMTNLNGLNMSVDNNGLVTLTTQDGSAVTLGVIAIGNVINPNGLTKESDGYYKAGNNAGDVSVGTCGMIVGGYLNNVPAQDDGTTQTTGDVMALTGVGATTILSGGLEASKTDIATEFADLITTQRGFQANTKIITVTDEMLSDLVSMKR
ncbi:MAG: flagellar hook-basal body complex protein [Butyricicoccus sp.]|nr:flagellar hook-basal body complex protein [Butyricicoccus sp.]